MQNKGLRNKKATIFQREVRQERNGIKQAKLQLWDMKRKKKN